MCDNENMKKYNYRKLLITMCFLLAIITTCGCQNKKIDNSNKNSAPDSETQIVVIKDTANIENEDANNEDKYIEDSLGIDSIQEESYWNESIDAGYTAEGKRIICWGDSLTEGTGGDGMSYPARLAELTGMEVLNYGVFAERASLIAARQGANPVHIEECDLIPAEKERVRVAIVNDNNGAWEMWCNFGDAGINPCEIAGVRGLLGIDESDGNRYFTRLEAGENVIIDSSNNSLMTFAMQDKRPNDILVIWSGSSDRRYDDRDIEEIIKYQRDMIEYAGCTEYLIIGFTTKLNENEADIWNQRLRNEYADRLVDARSYLLKHGLEDAGILPTEQDEIDLAEGRIPHSLRVDEGHGTADFYRIIGDLVYKKMIELGYISD